MRPVFLAFLFFLASIVSACGDPLVGFPSNDAAILADAIVRIDVSITDDGVDALVDLGAEDAFDLGDDATIPDAIVIDATIVDAAIVDAIVEDATIVDATAEDASIVDASVEDADRPDAFVFIDDVAPTVIRLNPERDEIDVPVNVDVIVTFSEPMDPLTVDGTLTLEAGGIVVLGTASYRGQNATFNPLAPLLPGIVYTATLAVGPTDLAGNALAAGQTWSFTTAAVIDDLAPILIATNPLDTAAFVPTDARVVAIFSEAMDVVSVTAAFELFDGVNLVPGAMDVSGAIATFTPTNPLLSDTLYTASYEASAADLAGNALAAPYTWTFTTARALDVTAPTVLNTVPANDDVEVPLDTEIVVTFSEPMDGTSVIAAIRIFDGVLPVDGTVSAAGPVGTFRPTGDLEPDRVYTGVVTTAATDPSGNPMAMDYMWSFTTGAAPDLRGPRVSAVVPADGRTHVSTASQVLVIFSEPMDPDSITSDGFIVLSPSGFVPGTYTFSGVTAVFTPDSPLAADTLYDIAVVSDVRDVAGNPLDYNYDWSFTTGGIADTSRPSVVGNAPALLAIDVAINAGLSVAFSEDMDPLLLTEDTFMVSALSGPVAGTVTGVGANATFMPSAPFEAATLYTATVRAEVADLSGNTLLQDHVWTFVTGIDDDIDGPLITQVWPVDQAIDVPITTVVTAAFDESMAAATLHTWSMTLMARDVIDVIGTVRYDANRRAVTFTPSEDLWPTTEYTATVTIEATDLAGNPMLVDYVWHFITGPNNQGPVGPDLRSLRSFVAVSGAGLTNSNSAQQTRLLGDVGLFPLATCLGDGAPCTLLNPYIDGTLYANDPEGVAARAKADLVLAFQDAMSRPVGTITGQLAGLTLPPGVYTSMTSLDIAVGGTVVLDAQGDANALWIFQVGSALTVNTSARVLLANGANADNVFWAIGSSATLGANVEFAGNVLASASLSLGTGTTVVGRLLCSIGAITLLGNTVTLP